MADLKGIPVAVERKPVRSGEKFVTPQGFTAPAFQVSSLPAMDIQWWHWLVLGLVLAVAELISAGGFYILFFGIGAIVVGLLASADAAGPLWMQMLLFSGISIGALVMFRGRLLRAVQHDPQAPPVDSLVGEVGVAAEDLRPGAIGKIELRGSTWSARNRGRDAVPRGGRCRVVRVDGLTLLVEPEGVVS